MKTKPSDDRNGCFLDSMWCCKVCGGEIPSGHTNNCDLWKLEKTLREIRDRYPPGVLRSLQDECEIWRLTNNALAYLTEP